MTFNIEQAKRIKEHYKYLIGEIMNKEVSDKAVTDILIAPTDATQQIAFISDFNQTSDNDLSLAKTGFNPNDVTIFFAHHDTWAGDVWTAELDKFLTRKGIEKVYLNPDF